jgi:hypothetical protein
MASAYIMVLRCASSRLSNHSLQRRKPSSRKVRQDLFQFRPNLPANPPRAKQLIRRRTT